MTDRTITRIAMLAGTLLSGAIVFAYEKGKQDGTILVTPCGDEDVTSATVPSENEPVSPSPGAPDGDASVSNGTAPLSTSHEDTDR